MKTLTVLGLSTDEFGSVESKSRMGSLEISVKNLSRDVDILKEDVHSIKTDINSIKIDIKDLGFTMKEELSKMTVNQERQLSNFAVNQERQFSQFYFRSLFGVSLTPCMFGTKSLMSSRLSASQYCSSEVR